MALSAEEQAIYDWIRATLPSWFFALPRAEEEMGALVKVFDRARLQIDFYREQAAVLTADGPSGSEPDWLNQHARERDTTRANGEADPGLRQRLRIFEDMLTRPALLSLIGGMLAAAGVTSTAFGLVELRRDRAFLLTRQQASGAGVAGDGFANVGTTMTLTIGAAPWAAWMSGKTLTIAGATPAANNGNFLITGFVGNTGVKFENAAGVAGPFGGTWKVNAAVHNRKASFLGRGYRMTGPPSTAGLVVITPFGTTEALRLAILEAVRTRKAAGISHTVERRMVP